MSNDFQVALDYINLSASYWDYQVMWMARYVRSSQVNLRPYSREGLRLVRGLTVEDRMTEARADSPRRLDITDFLT